jgi:hypothetical protein
MSSFLSIDWLKQHGFRRALERQQSRSGHWLSCHVLREFLQTLQERGGIVPQSRHWLLLSKFFHSSSASSSFSSTPVAPTWKRFLALQFLNMTIGRIPWTGDQPVARLLPKTNRINTDIHALSAIRTYDANIRVGEDISCLRPRGHCDRLFPVYCSLIILQLDAI